MLNRCFGRRKLRPILLETPLFLLRGNAAMLGLLLLVPESSGLRSGSHFLVDHALLFDESLSLEILKLLGLAFLFILEQLALSFPSLAHTLRLLQIQALAFDLGHVFCGSCSLAGLLLFLPKDIGLGFRLLLLGLTIRFREGEPSFLGLGLGLTLELRRGLGLLT
jgi:hypothetical protein